MNTTNRFLIEINLNPLAPRSYHMAQKRSKSLSITSWNVNGLFRRINGQRLCKLDEGEFHKNICSDIVFMCETHASYQDNLHFNGYKYIAVCRSQKPSRARGGLGVFI